jgi:hypothetical protein
VPRTSGAPQHSWVRLIWKSELLGLDYDNALEPWIDLRTTRDQNHHRLAARARNLVVRLLNRREFKLRSVPVRSLILCPSPIRGGNVIAIREFGSVAHVKENAVGLSLTLTPQELQTLDAAHPPPGR